MSEHVYQVGDIVCHTAKFLKSTRWYTNVPMNGRVLFAEEPDTRYPSILEVEWCDGHTSRILATNVVLYNKRHKEPG